MAATQEAGGGHTLAEPVSADAGMILELNELAVVYESVLSSQSHHPMPIFFLSGSQGTCGDGKKVRAGGFLRSFASMLRFSSSVRP